MEAGDVQIVSEAGHCRGGGAQAGHSGTIRPHGRCLRCGHRPGTHSERDGGRGGVDLRGVADGAVAPRPPDADVVVLAGQVVLGLGHRARARVPVEAGDCT